MRVAEYVIDRLAREGITHCFLTYGGAIADLVDALPGRMRYVVMQHEQAAVFAAEGYAKASGKPGLVMATSGPGGHNIVTGLANCFYDSTPLIAITGQVATAFQVPPGSGLRQRGFQESPIVEIVRPITKNAWKVNKAREAYDDIETAIHIAQEGRPGPVLLDIPVDVQKLEIDARAAWSFNTPAQEVDRGAVAAYRSDLIQARRPGILVGGGAHRAREEVQKFARLHELPIFRTWNALDVIADDHPCYAGTVGTYGGPGRNFGIQNTDLLLVLGCRLSGRITGGVPESFARGAKLYVVDVDHAMLRPENQPRKADVNVWCDVGRFVDALA